MSMFGVNKLHEFVAHNTTVNCLTFGPLSSQVVATGGEDFNVNVWRVGNASNIWTLGQNKSPIECLCFDSDEQCIVSGAMNGSLKVFDLNEGRLARNLRGHQVNITALDYHPYGEYIVSGSTDTTMKVWDVRNKTCIQTYTGHEKDITCVKFSPDGRWVASSAKDGQMLFWDLVAGKLMHTIKMAPAYASSFEFNPQEFLLAATTSMRTVKLWDMENFECIGTSSPEGTPLRALSFTRDGTSLCTASSDVLRVHGWDPVTSKGSSMVGWDKVMEIRLTEENVALCGSIISNFVSIWTVDISDALAAGANGVAQTPPPKTAGRATTSGGRGAARGAEYDAKTERKPSSVSASDSPSAAADEKSPAVTWEAGHNPKDMATTMNESFDARQRHKQVAAADAKSTPPSRPRYEDDDTNDDGASDLERMLPPSSFGGGRASSSVGVSPLQRRPAPQAPSAGPERTDKAYIGGREDMRRGYDPLQPGKEAPLAVVGSSHGKRKPADRPGSSSNEPVVAVPRSKPAYSYESIAEEENSRSEDQFNAVVERDGRSMMAVLSQRRSSLSLLRKHWDRGEIDDVVTHMQSLQVLGQQDPKQLIAAADFFGAVELRGHGMNLAACSKILPVLEAMLDGNLECLALASLRTMVTLVEVFGDLIRQTRSVMVAGGVDLSREDRLQKCNACHTVLCRIRSRLDVIRSKYRKSRKFLEVIEASQNMLDDLC